MYEQACQTSKLFVKIVSDFFFFFFFLQRFHSSQVIFTCSKWNCQWRRSDVFSVNFGHISNIFQLFLLLTLNKQILDEILDRVLNTPLYKNSLKIFKKDFEAASSSNCYYLNKTGNTGISSPQLHKRSFFKNLCSKCEHIRRKLPKILHRKPYLVCRVYYHIQFLCRNILTR